MKEFNSNKCKLNHQKLIISVKHFPPDIFKTFLPGNWGSFNDMKKLVTKKRLNYGTPEYVAVIKSPPDPLLDGQ